MVQTFIARSPTSNIYPHRRGMAVILVMAALTITLALAYALSRCSIDMVKVAANQGAGADARRAATAAAGLALENLAADPNWLPEPNPMTGSLPTGEPYQVDVQPGEKRNLDISAFAQVLDPKDRHVLANQHVTVKLVKQRLDNFPTAAITAYAQAGDSGKVPAVYVAAGTTINGNIRTNGTIEFQAGFSLDGKAYLLGDVAAYSTALGDYQDYRTVWGTTYQAQPLPQNVLQNDGGALVLRYAELGPTPANPMGVYYHIGNLRIGNQVTVRGTVVVTGDVEITGENVRIVALGQAIDPCTEAKYKTTFPALVVDGSIVFSEKARHLRIRGLLLARADVRRDGEEGAADEITPTLEGDTTLELEPEIRIRGAITAKRVELKNVKDHPFQLVFSPDLTDVIDAPGFFGWKITEWEESN